jgi:hypothetical protein
MRRTITTLVGRARTMVSKDPTRIARFPKLKLPKGSNVRSRTGDFTHVCSLLLFAERSGGSPWHP